MLQGIDHFVVIRKSRLWIRYTVPPNSQGGDAKIKPDWISGLLIVSLIATLWAFFTGAFPYPYGWIVLMALLVMRLTAKQKKE